MVQGELFREEPAGGLTGQKPRSFLTQYEISITLDKILIGCIGLGIVFVLSYSFGVEKGKRAMEKRLEAYLPDEKQPVSSLQTTEQATNSREGVVLMVNQAEPAVAEPVSEPPVKAVPQESNPVQKTVLPLVDQTKTGAYTIQLVTYGSEVQALREIERLKTQGFSGFVIPSGRYFQVCVNYFDNKDLAKGAFKRLRENGRYPGAFVRPVIR